MWQRCEVQRTTDHSNNTQFDQQLVRRITAFRDFLMNVSKWSGGLVGLNASATWGNKTALNHRPQCRNARSGTEAQKDSVCPGHY